MSLVAVDEPRLAYVDNLFESGLLWKLVQDARSDDGHVLIVIGECTSSVHERFLDKIMGVTMASSGRRERVPLSASDKDGTGTQIENFKLKYVNASKTGKPKKSGAKSETDSEGLGVHALTAYMLLNVKSAGKKPGFKLDPCLLTLTDGTRQNMLSLTYGPNGEKHAFAHLLNKKENALANELARCDYVSVGGDLNNITIGEDLVETAAWDVRSISTGSNSTSSVMYDKITILE